MYSKLFGYIGSNLSTINKNNIHIIIRSNEIENKTRFRKGYPSPR